MQCKLCKNVDEIVGHIVSDCSKLAEEECKRRHDNSGKKHWKLARNCNFNAGEKWYKHK